MIITWVLILSLSAPSTSGGQSIAHIPGFSTWEECRDAGTAWLTAVAPGIGAARPSAVCAKQTIAK